MANSNSFFESLRRSSDSSRKQIFREIFLFYREIVCCVYSLESPHRGDSNEYTQHTTYNYCVENRKKKSLNYRHLLPDGTIINPLWLEPLMSRTIFYGPKDVRAIEIRLY